MRRAGLRLRESYLGQAGRAIEPIVQPLGWDWKIGMATLASFPAREVIIAALGTIYNLGAGQDAESVALREAMRAEHWPGGRPVYTPVCGGFDHGLFCLMLSVWCHPGDH